MTWGQLGELVAAERPTSTGPATTATTAARSRALSALLGSADVDTGPVSRETALTVPALHRGANLIAGTIGSLPLRCYRGMVPQDDTYAGKFLSQPEPDRPRSHTIAETCTDLIFDGIAAWWITGDRYADGTPRTVRRMAPNEFSIQSDWSVRYAGERIAYQDVIVFWGPDSTTTVAGTIARGILSTAARTIRTAIRLEEAAARYAWNEVPYGSLSQEDGAEELDEPEVEELLSSWETARRRRATAFLPQGLKYNPVTGPNPEQLQLTEARTFIASEISRHLNLPPRYVGASSGDPMTYNSQGADRRDLMDLGLRTWFAAIEERLSMDRSRTDVRVATVTPQGMVARFDRRDFEAAEPNVRVDSVVKLKDAELIDEDEARAMLGLPPRGVPA